MDDDAHHPPVTMEQGLALDAHYRRDAHYLAAVADCRGTAITDGGGGEVPAVDDVVGWTVWALRHRADLHPWAFTGLTSPWVAVIGDLPAGGRNR